MNDYPKLIYVGTEYFTVPNADVEAEVLAGNGLNTPTGLVTPNTAETLEDHIALANAGIQPMPDVPEPDEPKDAA